MNGPREEARRAFLEQAGWAAAAFEWLAGDASFRRYARLSRDGERAILMDAPPPESVAAFKRIAELLLELGLSAPMVYAWDAENGFMLLEDLGDRTFTRALAEGHDEAELYALALDTLIALQHRVSPPLLAEADLPRYDEAELLREALLLVDWYYPAVTGEQAPAAQRDAFIAAWREVFALLDAVPATLVLRDFHVDNLMVVEDRTGVAACGLLDFQDAVVGPVAYDLVSLLEDARRDLPEALVADLYQRYLAAFPGLDRETFAAAYAILGAQRHAKVIGIFTRLDRRDGKPRYLGHIERVWRLMHASLAHPALLPVKAWLDQALPPERRITPEEAPT